MNIDEFLDSVAAQNLSKTPIQSTSMGVNAVPSDAFVRSVMNAKFTAPPTPGENDNSTILQKSPSSSTTPLASAVNSQPVTGAIEQFESLSIALETSLASADYQHAFDTYIALQSALAHLHEQQKRQQRLFQDRLNEFKTRLFAAVQVSTAQFQSVMQELYLHIGQIKQLVDANQIESATTQYTSVKHTIEQLPNNFSDKKEKLQDELLKVYLYLKDRSETHTAASFTDISNDMKRLYVSAVAAIKTANFVQAQQLYEQLAAKYAQLPDGFTEQKVQLFDYVTFLHSQLTLDGTSTPRAQASANVATTMPTQAISMQNFPSTTATSSSSSKQSAQSTPKVVEPQRISQVAPVVSQVKAPEKVAPVISPEVKSVEEKPDQEKLAKILSSVPKPENLDVPIEKQKPQIKSSATQVSTSTQTTPDFRVHISPTVRGYRDSYPIPRNDVAPKPSAKPQTVKVPVQAPAQAPASASVSAEPTQNPNTQSAQQLQERAKKLAARLIELKQSLEQ